MWLFLIFGLPLALAHAIATWFPASELHSVRRTLLRGLISSIPVWFLSRFLGSLLPTMSGSPAYVFHEWFDRILPYSLLPLLAYAIFWRLDEPLEGDFLQRRLTVFYAGCLAPFGFGEMTRIELSPDLFGLVILPIILISIPAIMPALFRAWTKAWMTRRILIGTCFVLAGLLASLPHWLLLARYWYLALVIIACLMISAWSAALPGLYSRPARKIPLV